MSESTEYPSIRVLDLALFLKSRIEVIDLYQSKEFIQTHDARKREIDLIIREFPIIAECLKHVDKVEGYY